MASIVVSDDQGNSTDYPWPAGKTMLGNAAFADLCTDAHLSRYPEATELCLHLMDESEIP